MTRRSACNPLAIRTVQQPDIHTRRNPPVHTILFHLLCDRCAALISTIPFPYCTPINHIWVLDKRIPIIMQSSLWSPLPTPNRRLTNQIWEGGMYSFVPFHQNLSNQAMHSSKSVSPFMKRSIHHQYTHMRNRNTSLFQNIKGSFITQLFVTTTAIIDARKLTTV